jgi:hypothetical protein
MKMGNTVAAQIAKGRISQKVFRTNARQLLADIGGQMKVIDRVAEWALLESNIPGMPPTNVGVLIVVEGRMHLRMLPNWWRAAPEDQRDEKWRQFEDDLALIAEETNGAQVLRWLEASNRGVRIQTRQTLRVHDANAMLEHLYRNHVSLSQDNGGGHTVRAEPEQIPDEGRESQIGFDPNRWRPYKAFRTLAAAAAITIATLLLRYSQRKTVIRLRQPVTVTQDSMTELPLASPTFAIELPNLDVPVQLRPSPSIRPRRIKTFVRRRLDVENWPIRDEPTSMAPTIVSAPPDIGLDVDPQDPIIIAPPAPPAYQPKHRGLRRFLALLFHRTSKETGTNGDQQHQIRDAAKTTDGCSKRDCQGDDPQVEEIRLSTPCCTVLPR